MDNNTLTNIIIVVIVVHFIGAYFVIEFLLRVQKKVRGIEYKADRANRRIDATDARVNRVTERVDILNPYKLPKRNQRGL